MENAFPRVWAHHICTILYQLGLRGPFPTLHQNYLKNRTFRVRADNHHSSIHVQENGIPQGSPLSGTFCLIAINDITRIIKPPFHFMLFTDDLSIHLRSSNPERAHRLLRNQIKVLYDSISARGFRISTFKTGLIIFQKKRKPSTQFPPVLLQKAVISRVDTIRFLGLHFWIPHIKLIRAKCLRKLIILKIFSHPKTGCNRKILLPIYQNFTFPARNP